MGTYRSGYLKLEALTAGVIGLDTLIISSPGAVAGHSRGMNGNKASVTRSSPNFITESGHVLSTI